MNVEEYEARQRRLAADIEDARQALQRAQGHLDYLCEQARDLRAGWQEQQQRESQP